MKKLKQHLMKKEYAITLIIKCVELPKYAYLIPLAGKKYVDMDDIYDPKMLIWKETLFNCDEELLIKMVDEIYEHDIGTKKEEITII